ncbi:MAG: AsmA family protein [Rickettsiales bacterium]|jgi:hypothetical protein|nr:AsmA family protein [Rickettsiales bacterium]
MKKKLRLKNFIYNFALWTRLLGLTLMAAAVSLGIYLYTTDPNKYKDRIISEINESSGVSIDKWGKVSWDISPRPVIVFEDVSVSMEGMTASLKKMSVRINLISLFRERVSIEQIAIDNLNLDVSEGGLPAGASAKAGGGQRIIERIPAHELVLRNSRLTFDGETYSPKIFKITIDRRHDADVVGVRIVSGSDVYDIKAVLANLNEERKIYPIRASVSGGGLDLTADVALERTSLVPIDFKLRGTALDLSRPFVKLGANFPKIMPVVISADGGFGHSDLKLRRFEMKSALPRGGNGVRASGDVSWSSARPFANLDVKTDRMVLAEIFPTLYGGKWTRPNRPLNVFKDIPLPVSMLEAWDMNIDLDSGGLVMYRELALNNIKAVIKLKNSSFALKTDLVFGGGTVNAMMHGGIEEHEVRAYVAALGERIYISNILSEIRQSDLMSGLPVNIEFAGRARGADLSRVFSTLTARAQAHSVGNGYARKELVSSVYGKDFLTSLGGDLAGLFKTSKDEDSARISCAAANLKARDGVIETKNGVALESSVFNINMAGDLDLGGETIRVSMTSRPVSGLRLSITGDLMSLMEFSGSLAEPSLSLNASGLLKKTAYTAAGVAGGLALAPFTGGASLVVGAAGGWLGGNLLSSWLADPSPCKTAMESGSAPSRKSDPRFMRIPLSDAVSEIFEQAGKGL